MSKRKENFDNPCGVLYCQNCHRSSGDGVDLKRSHRCSIQYSLWFVSKEDLGPDGKCLLCNVCRDNTHPWTAFIWNLLCDELNFPIIWKFLPYPWKEYWRKEVERHYRNVIDMNSTSFILDMTEEINQYHKQMDLENLKNTKWEDFVMNFEKYVAIPLVRCPWGCCESLNKVNFIPYDVVLSHFVKKSIPMYSETKEKDYRYSFRNDLMDNPCDILLKWSCKVCVVIKDAKPYILTCRFHSIKHNSKYIHAPRSPTGSISFQGDNTLAKIVAVPRTIGTFRKQKYNNSYGMMRLTGNFGGIDCINVSTQNEYLNKKSNILTLRRDELVRIGRLDYDDSKAATTIGTSCNEEDKMLLEKYAKGSTYMSMEDVIKLQKQMRDTPINMITVVSKVDGIQLEKNISYVPCWNDLPLKICIYGDALGEPFYVSKAFSLFIPNDFRIPFFYLSNIVVMIPEIWKLVSSNVKRNDTWHGWLLQYLSRKVLCLNERGRVGSKHPFYTYKKSALQKLMDIFTASFQANTQNLIEGTIGCFHNVKVINDGYLPLGIADHDTVIAIITIYNSNLMRQTLFPTTIISNYGLRMVGYTDINDGSSCILIKHKETNCFWKYTRRASGIFHVGLTETESNDILNSVRSVWKFCVYIRDCDIDVKAIKSSLIQSIGGQTKIKCAIHDKPVVVIPMWKRKIKFENLTCSNFCRNDQTMRCPIDGCYKGLCGSCFRNIMMRKDKKEWIIGETLNNYIDENSEDDSSLDSIWTLCSVLEEEDDTLEYDDCSDDGIDNYSNDSDCNSKESRVSFCDTEDYDASLSDTTSDESSAISLIMEAEEEDNDDLVWNLEDESSDSSDDEADTPMKKDPDLFGATNVAKKGFLYDPASMIREGLEIPNHVILNSVGGSCLVRRNYTLKPSTTGRHFIEKMVTTEEGGHLPILFYEGSMFPTIFYKSNSDGSVIGSLPICLLADDKTLNKLGVATMLDHTRARLMNPDLLTSTCKSFWGYSYDLSANLGTRGYDTQLVLRRGFDSSSEGLKNQFRVSTEDPRLYDSEMIDSRKTVNQLAAACAKKKSDLFFTWTMNASATPGVRIITDWLRSEEGYKKLQNEIIYSCTNSKMLPNRNDLPLLEKDREGLQEEFEDGGCIYVIRAWMEFVELFLYYLQYGRDSPFKGQNLEIGNIWNRSEIQNDRDGKAPHQHTLIFLKNPPTNENDLNEVLGLIRACMEYFCTKEEEEKIKKNGILSSSFGTMREFLEKAEELLKHHCTSRCLIPIRKKTKFGEVVNKIERKCKQPDYRLLSSCANVGRFYSIEVEHDENAKKILMELGMIENKYQERENANLLDFIPKEKYLSLLTSQRYCPPCASVGVKQSLANPFLFGMTCSAINLQYTDGYLIQRYLAKYVASVDKSNRIELTMKQHSDSGVAIKPDVGFNSKITSNQILAKENESKKDVKKIIGRTLPMSEIVMQSMAYTTILTDFKFEYIPTQSLAFRTSVPRKRPVIEEIMKEYDDVPNLRDLNISYINANHEVRTSMKFEHGRMFSNHQLVTFADSLYDNAKIDKIGQFSLRPPELTFIMTPCKYLTWFTRRKLKNWKDGSPAVQKVLLEKILHHKFESCPWIDCCGYQVKVRLPAIVKICKLLEKYPKKYIKSDFGSVQQYNSMLVLFQLLNGETKNLRNPQNMRSAHLRGLFVDEKYESDTLPIYWYRTVRSTDAERFLYHVLLSMGSFVTEFELYTKGSMKKAFVHARLLDDSSEEVFIESLKDLTKRYLTKQLFNFPIGTHALDREIIETEKIFDQFFRSEVITSINMPSALFTQLREKCTDDIEHAFLDSREDLVKSFTRRLKIEFPVDIIPSDSDIINATRTKTAIFDIGGIPRTANQSEVSYQEHQAGYLKIKDQVDHYVQGTNTLTKSVIIVGAGGVGKTIDLRIAGVYAMSQGLSVFSTTLTGKRGAETAGEHLHVRFKIPVNDYTLSINAMVERAYAALLKDIQHLVYLQRVDVLLIDELGQISSKLLAVIDRLMRRIRHSNLFMGGVLVVATMDGKQMKPITGFSPVLSPSIICCFEFICLMIPLRTLDPILQSIQLITRKTPNELREGGSALEEEFKNKILEHCTFFPDYDSLREHYESSELIYCYPRHEDCIIKEHTILKEVKQILSNEGKDYSIRKADDFERIYMQMEPSRASLSTSKALDKHSPSRELVFYEGAAFEITFNDTNRKFFKGQLCILLHLPKKEDLALFKPIQVLRAPTGTDNLPPMPYDKVDLLTKGWEEVLIGKEKPDKYYKIGKKGLAGYRRQYGLKHWISITIHGIMGATVNKLVTRLDNLDNKGLWEAAMVVVLLSRTKLAKDLIFIGNAHRTVNTLWNALLAGGKYNEITQYVLDCLIAKQSQSDHVLKLPYIQKMFSQLPTLLPSKGNYVVYLLVSTKDPESTYVGYTGNIRKRLNKHNSYNGGSYGTGIDHSNLAPFGLLAMVVGFTEKSHARSFEQIWKNHIDFKRRSTKGKVSSMTLMDLANPLIKDVEKIQSLHLVQCGYVKEQNSI